MSDFDDVAMDFGDDDDGDDFLSGKLAALGIDEDLELSGGEEEDENPAPTTPAASSEHPSSPPSSSASAPAAVALGAAATEDWGAAPNQVCLSADIGGWGENRKAAISTGGRGARPVDDGALVDMLGKPLRASRGRPANERGSADRDSDKSARGGGGRKGGGSRGSGERPKNDGRARGRNITIKECAKWMCKRLGEPKYYLMCRVVATIGYKKTRDLLESVRETQDAGGMPTADGSRKRTPGGVFFTLLKEHMEPATLKELYADEIRVKKEKDRARRAANKRKAEAALAGEDVMTPRDPPRSRGRSGSRGSASKAGRNMGMWASPAAAGGSGGGDG